MVFEKVKLNKLDNFEIKLSTFEFILYFYLINQTKLMMKLLKSFGLLFLFTMISAMDIDVKTPNATVDWISLEEAQSRAAADEKPIFIFVEAEWCGLCKQMIRNVFPEEVIDQLLSERFHAVSIDLDSKKKILFNGEEKTEREFARSMEVMATPTIIFIDHEGEEIGRRPGFMNTEQFNKLLLYVTSEKFNDVSFEEFSVEG